VLKTAPIQPKDIMIPERCAAEAALAPANDTDIADIEGMDMEEMKQEIELWRANAKEMLQLQVR
jgi:hypothetical protein